MIFAKDVQFATMVDGNTDDPAEIRIRFNITSGDLHVDVLYPDGDVNYHSPNDTEEFNLFDYFDDTPLIDKIAFMCWAWRNNNHMLGTIEQYQCLQEQMIGGGDTAWEDIARALQTHGIYTCHDVRFGDQDDIRLDVPEEVLQFLFDLPGEGNTFNDVKEALSKMPDGIREEELLLLTGC